MRARRAPTATVVSTATSMARRVPATGDGISVSTLSVETSRSASSTATESPTFLSQRVTVPSLTDSPSAGIVMTVPPLDATGAATGAATGVAGGGVGATGAATTGAATGAAGAATGAGADAPALSAITASSAPTATVWSTATTIFVRTPATGDGISVSTLSVDTSRSGSSTATMSPSFLSQRVTVPSLTLSPRAGIVTENDIVIFSSYLTV